MQIDYVVPFFYPNLGGTESNVWNVSRWMASKGHTVIVNTSDYSFDHIKLPMKESVDGVEIRRYRLYPGPQIFPKLPLENKQEVIHVHSFGMNPNVLEIMRARNRNSVFTPHAMFMGNAYKLVSKRLMGKMLLSFKFIFAQTENERFFLVDALKIPHNRVVVMPPGLNNTNFKIAFCDRRELFDSFGWIGNFDYFVSLGRVVSIKNVWVGIRALTLLPKQIHYVISGPLYDKYTYINSLALANRLGLSDRVHFTGAVGEERKRQLLYNATLYLASGYEAYSIAALEAKALGVPVVAANWFGLSEVVRDQETGLLFEYCNPNSAATCINTLISDKLLRLKLAFNGRNEAWNKNRWDFICARLEEMYTKLVSNSIS